MSRVFVAEDLQLGRNVVLKVLPPDLAAGLSIERFRREIHLAAQLQHPNVVPLHASGQADGLLYYTMPLVEGESLRTKLAREGEQPVSETIRLLRDVADALAYAHEHGVVHRDIKPDNVLVSRHHGLVTDFGVAKALTESSGGPGAGERSTSVGVALGTPAYMAPEQAAADPHADHRVDIYALGVLGYEMLTGRPPFTGPTPQAVLAAQVTQRPETVSALRSSVPPALAALVMRCLEKKPADRWQSAEEVLQELEGMTTPSGGTTPTAATRGVPRGSRSLLKAALLLFAVAAVGTALWRKGASRPVGENLSDSLVAVLPFRVTGADPALAYLGDGMVDLLAARLTGEGGPRAVDPRVAISSYRRATTSDEDNQGDPALMAARRVGAGQVINGGVVGSPARLVLTASLRRVPSGVVHAQASVQGPADSLAVLIDGLAAQLLLTGAGETEQAATSIALPALRAFLDGQAAYRQGRYEQAVSSYQRALRVDSSFALAALGLVWASQWGATNSDYDGGARLAWAARDRLSPRDRLLLETEIGSKYPTPSSAAEILAARERAVKVVPDRADSWYQLGDWYHHWGSVLGEVDPWTRAGPALRRALELDSTFAAPLVHLIERANGAGDTALVGRLGTFALRLDSTGPTADYFRWHMALAFGDTLMLSQVRSRFDQMSIRILSWIAIISEAYGLPIEDARRAIEVVRGRAGTRESRRLRAYFSHDVAMNGARPNEGLAATRELSEDPEIPRLDLYEQVLDAIYWEGDSTAAREAARRLVKWAEGTSPLTRSEREHQDSDICVLEQWRLKEGKTATTASAISRLRAPRDSTYAAEKLAYGEHCALILDAWAAVLRKRPAAGKLLASLDSLTRTGPTDWFAIQWANLLLSRLHQMNGDLPAATAAIRRGNVFAIGPLDYLSSYLREQGRLFASTGDHKRAIQAYQHYLALRVDPEPSRKQDVDEVRAELAKLVGER
jgi:serine/threonine-protein kinase